MMNLNNPKEWLFDQCCKDVTKLTAKQFKGIFGDPKTGLTKARRFCEERGLTLRKEGRLFVFELTDTDFRGTARVGNVTK